MKKVYLKLKLIVNGLIEFYSSITIWYNTEV